MTNRKGFTLIEMLVVIAIIGLLSSVVVVGLGGARKKARDARRITDIQSIQNALELAYDSSTGYPDEATGMAVPTSLNAPTEDSQGNAYLYDSAGQTYELGTCLESGDGATGIGPCPALTGLSSCGASGANAYCVAQP